MGQLRKICMAKKQIEFAKNAEWVEFSFHLRELHVWNWLCDFIHHRKKMKLYTLHQTIDDLTRPWYWIMPDGRLKMHNFWKLTSNHWWVGSCQMLVFYLRSWKLKSKNYDLEKLPTVADKAEFFHSIRNAQQSRRKNNNKNNFCAIFIVIIYRRKADRLIEKNSKIVAEGKHSIKSTRIVFDRSNFCWASHPLYSSTIEFIINYFCQD